MPAVADAALRRLLDVTVAGTLLLVALAPLLAVLALLVRATSPGPALFRQIRIGRDGRPFVLLKLRTMRADAAARAPRSRPARDPRITPLGARLRRAKLDELPQLWNVLRGDMSLVGPRPEVPHYVARLHGGAARGPAGAARPHRPRVARLGGRGGRRSRRSPIRERAYAEVVLPRKLALSLAYLERRTVWSDLAVVTRTAAHVARTPCRRRSDAVPAGAAIRPGPVAAPASRAAASARYMSDTRRARRRPERGEHARRPSRFRIPAPPRSRGRPGPRAARARPRRTRPGRGRRPDARGRLRRFAGPGGRWARYAATPPRAEIDGVRLLFPRYLQVPGMGPWAGVAMALGAAGRRSRRLRREGRCDVLLRAGHAARRPGGGAARALARRARRLSRARHRRPRPPRAPPRRRAGSRAGRLRRTRGGRRGGGGPGDARSPGWRAARACTVLPETGSTSSTSRPAARATRGARSGSTRTPAWSSTSDASPTGRDSTRCSTRFGALRTTVPDALLALVGSGPLQAAARAPRPRATAWRVRCDSPAKSPHQAHRRLDAGRRRRGAAERGRRHARTSCARRSPAGARSWRRRSATCHAF